MDFVLKIVFIISLIISAFSQEIELKPLIILIPLFYIFLFFLLKDHINKLTFLFLEVLITIYFVYLTGNTYVSLLFLILLPYYMDNLKYFLSFLGAGIIPFVFSVYLSGYFDFTFTLIYFSFYISFLLNKKIINRYEKEINKLKSNLISLTSDFMKSSNKAKFFDLSKFHNLSLKNSKETLFYLYSNLNTSGIALFDIENNRCISVGKIKCNKEFLKYIQSDIYYFKYNDKYVIVVPVYKYDEISKVFFIFYENEKLIDNMNIFYYLKLKFENEILSGLKSVSNFIEGVDKKVL